MKRRFLRLSDATLVLAVTGCFAIAAPAAAESSKVISVEEHWELRISQPDNERSAPQITMLMSPVGNVDGTHFFFTINHSTVPQYAPGGLQVQQWEGDDLVQDRTVRDGEALNSSEEVVSWTQRLTVHEGKLIFQVLSGQSETWGTFGGDSLSSLDVVYEPMELQKSPALVTVNARPEGEDEMVVGTGATYTFRFW